MKKIAMTLKNDRPFRCWADGPETEDGMSTTCMLDDEHGGPHEWTRDDHIGIRFAPTTPEQQGLK